MNNINQTIRSIYLSHQEDEIIDLNLLAQECVHYYDPSAQSPEEVSYAAQQQFHNMFRKLCRESRRQHDDRQGRLFDDELQDRYPVKRNSRNYYALREYLTLDERIKIIKDMMQQRKGLTRHIDQLTEETKRLFPNVAII